MRFIKHVIRPVRILLNCIVFGIKGEYQLLNARLAEKTSWREFIQADARGYFAPLIGVVRGIADACRILRRHGNE